MKKLFVKDKNLRFFFKNINTKYFILKSIIKNKNLFILVRYKSYFKLIKLIEQKSIVKISNRCVESYNKKSFNKFTFFSRFIFFKVIKNGHTNFQKSVW